MAPLYSAISRALLLTLCLIGFVTCTKQVSLTSVQPIYAIAHRVLRPSAVTDALAHGANALEVDLTAHDDEWWIEHPGQKTVTAREHFTFIADERRKGQNIIFVWLDIKNPDHCPYRGQPCSVSALQKLVRETLEPAGIKVLYGFYQTDDSYEFTVISESLNDNEAVSINGAASDVVGLYAYTDIPVKQRIMDYGAPHLDQGYGDCHEVNGRGLTCANLRQGSDGRDKGLLGKVMGWTATRGDTERVNMLFLSSRVDGIIYGFQDDIYKDDPVTREALHDISSFVESHSDTLRMATVDDAPW